KITGTEIPRMARAKKRANPRDFPKAAKTASVAMLGKCRKKTAKMAGLTPRWPVSSSPKGPEPIALQNGSELVQEFARIFGATPLSCRFFHKSLFRGREICDQITTYGEILEKPTPERPTPPEVQWQNCQLNKR